jgi:hypothetical protein
MNSAREIKNLSLIKDSNRKIVLCLKNNLLIDRTSNGIEIINVID